MKRKNLKRAIRFAADECGAAAVEFAMVASAFISMIFGITYISIMLHHRATLQWAVESAIRKAAITTTVTQTAMQNEVNAYMLKAGMGNVTTTYTVAAGAIPVATLTSTFSQSYTIPFVATFNINYSATAQTPQGS